MSERMGDFSHNVNYSNDELKDKDKIINQTKG